MENSKKQKSTKKSLLKSSFTNMLVIAVLIFGLLIPLAYVKNLIIERKLRQSSVVSEINKSWGNEVILYGPILKVPYVIYDKTIVVDDKTKQKKIIKKKRETKHIYFFPNQLNYDGSINSEIKKRGIYKTAVYKTEIAISGNFTEPNFDFLGISDEDILWDKSKILFKTTNLKGLNDEILMHLSDLDLSFKSKLEKSDGFNDTQNEQQTSSYYTIETESFNSKKLFKIDSISFDMDYNASGNSRFHIIPIGKETRMHLKSNWLDSSFDGEYLPYNSDKLKKDGFDAYWKVLEMNRPFPQKFKNLPNLDKYSYGVNFFIPVDNYQQNERSAKYGYLMIALTFLLFFLIQTLSKISIHPFQYLMIGLALVIFYVLLVSISEHSDFSKAYLISSTAVITLITLYSKSILRIWKFPLFIGISLSTLYAFIFVIIKQQSYALLIGSIGLFSILATVMYVSRKIEWE